MVGQGWRRVLREREKEQESRKNEWLQEPEGHSRDQEGKEEQERDGNGPAPEQAEQIRAANQGIRKRLIKQAEVFMKQSAEKKEQEARGKRERERERRTARIHN